MTRRDTDPEDPANRAESARIRTNGDGGFFRRGPNDGVMARNRVSMGFVVTLVVLAGTGLVVAGGTGEPGGGAVGAEDPRAGAHLAGLVGVQDSELREAVDDGTFRARFADASSSRERARLLDDRLNASLDRLDALESRLQALDRARENGSLDGSAYTARRAAVSAEARAVVRDAEQLAALAADLPPALRRDLPARIESLRSHAVDLRDRTVSSAAALGPTDDDPGVGPFTLTEVREVIERGVGVPDALAGVAGSERVNVHVRRANGTTAVYFARIEAGEVVSVERGGTDDPSLYVYTDYRVVRNVRTADDPGAAVRAAVDSGRISYDGVGIVNSAKYGFAKLASLVAGAFLWLVALFALVSP